MKDKTRTIELTIDYAISLNGRYQIGKRQMNNITKKTLFDLIKKNRGFDLNVFITDCNKKHFYFSVNNSKRFVYPFNNYDFWITCGYTDFELYENGFITTDLEYSNLNDTEYTNNLFIDYENNQHRKLDYLYSEYEFNKN